MIRYLFFLVMSLSVGAQTIAGLSEKSSPTPQGDTKMGADAATSGTNIEDVDAQAQEDERTLNVEHKNSPHEKEELEKDQKINKSN